MLVLKNIFYHLSVKDPQALGFGNKDMLGQVFSLDLGVKGMASRLKVVGNDDRKVVCFPVHAHICYFLGVQCQHGVETCSELMTHSFGSKFGFPATMPCPCP